MSAVVDSRTEIGIKTENINSDDESFRDLGFNDINGKSVSENEQTNDLGSDLNGLKLNWKGKWTTGKRGRPPKLHSHTKDNSHKNKLHSSVENDISQKTESKNYLVSEEQKVHKVTNGIIDETMKTESLGKVEKTKESESKNEMNCGRINRLQLKKTSRKKSSSSYEKTELEVAPNDLSDCQQVNGEEKCNEISKENSLVVTHSSILFGSVSETPYRSRYGRLHKASLNPDMEFVPLIRKRSTPVKPRSMKSGSLTLKVPMSSSPDQLATSPKTTPTKRHSISQNYTIDVSILSTSPEINSTSEELSSANTTYVETQDQVLDSPPAKRSKLISIDEKDIPCEWLVGDLLWSKIAGHPWWPSMVSFDPLLGIYTKILNKGSRKPHRIYHVQYFGREAERSWTVPNGCMVFEGQAKFEEYVEKLLQSAPSKGVARQKLLAKYKVKSTRKDAWLLAVAEAEDALKMTRAERKQELTFEYTDSKKNSNKRDVTSPYRSNTEIKAKRHKSLTPCTPKSYNDVQNNKHSKLAVTPRRKKCKGQFNVYLQKHLSQARLQHPDFSEEALEEYLHLQWDRMSEQQRARYTSRLVMDEVKGEKYEKKEKAERNERTESQKNEETSLALSPEQVLVKEEAVDNHSTEITGLIEPQSTNVEVQDLEQSDHSPSDSSSVQDPLESDFNVSISTRSEQACQLCEKPDDVIVCKGPCKQTFHPGCLGLTQLPSNFQCDECTTGKHTCFACKQSDGVTRKCNIPSCGKFYHEECVKNYPLTGRIEGRNMVCPLHACLACLADNPKQSRLRSRLIKCIRCPTAYHPGDGCISAGSVFISPHQIVCANHFQPKKGKQYQSRVNASWCFICSIGGSLICCESCPAAFHIECLEIQQPEGSYYCEDCEVGKHPRYGDIVWVKLGCYRWWPAKICHSKSVPQNIQNMFHDVGDFPVEFFGSHDYYWTHRGRVFLFQDGDKGSKEHSVNRNLAKVFQKAVDEASEAFQVWQSAKHAKELHDNERRYKPPFYKAIKLNKPVGKVQIPPVDLSRINRCECDPTSDNPCGIDSDCLNRMTMFECHPSICPAGERCQNQKFQKREYTPAAPFRTESRGWGLKALVDIKKGQFVNEYVGELIDEEECERRLKQMHEDNDENFYFLTLDKERTIDAGPKGNQARFMNHSCLPNCETQKWTVNGDTRVGLFAITDITAGMELTFNYNLECRGSEKTKCCCGASTCSGYIGIRPKTIFAASQEKKARESTVKKKKKRSQTRRHEDECFRCGEGGELVMCDRKSCPKSYHLNCLSLTKPPYGRWECPWHHCDDCGKPSTMMCSECPNSFCKDHYMQEKIQQQDGRLLCNEHADDNSEVSEYEENERKNDEQEIAALCSNLIRDAENKLS